VVNLIQFKKMVIGLKFMFLNSITTISIAIYKKLLSKRHNWGNLRIMIRWQSVFIKPIDNTDHSETDKIGNLFLIRRRLLKSMLITLVVMGLPALVISCIEAIKLGQLVGVFLYGGIYLLVSATTLYFKRLPFGFCSGVMLTSLYMIAVFNFFHFGFAGAGIAIAITISVLATVLLGMGGGLVTAATCLVTLISIGLCFVYGAIEVNPEMPATTTNAVSWMAAAAVFALLTGSLVFCSGRLQRYLIKSLESLRFKTEKLKESNKDLTREIKQRKMTEAKLKQSEMQFKTLFEAAPDAIYLTDLEGTLLDGNHSTETLIGSSKEAFIGKKFIDTGLLPKTEISKALTLLEKSRKGERTGLDELTLISSAGKETTVEILTRPFELGERSVILGIARDVSERKRLETRLNQAQKMESIGTLAGGIAHDFNNILFPILGHTEMLLHDVTDDSSFRTSLESIYSAAGRAKELVKQILTFSRQESSELRLMKMQPVIKEALKLIRSSIPTTIEIKQDIRKECGMIKADPTQIHQVVMNLTTNAYHAMEETGGELNVSLKEIELGQNDLINPDMAPGSYAFLTIADTGVGMDKQLTERIFEPFFTTKEQGKGTGMGLSVVHGIVKSINGVIQVHSDAGKGTEFHIYLPVSMSVFERQETRLNGPLEGGTERVLLIDDEEGIIKMEKLALERLGYQVTSKISSIEALEVFKNCPNKFDLVITDMAMPKIPGDKLAVELIKIRPDIPILLCTGFSETMSEEKAASLGIMGFLLKPIVMKDFSQKIREVLDNQKSMLSV
jgi:PAS domain S-box-containing protein